MNELGDNLLTPVVKIAAISAGQTIAFVLLYEAAAEIYISNVGDMNRIFGFEMQMNYGLYLLSILAGINSLAQVLLERLEHRLMAAIVLATVWIAYWGNIAAVVPNRFALISILGMLSFLAGVLLTTPPRCQRFA